MNDGCQCANEVQLIVGISTLQSNYLLQETPCSKSMFRTKLGFLPQPASLGSTYNFHCPDLELDVMVLPHPQRPQDVSMPRTTRRNTSYTISAISFISSSLSWHSNYDPPPQMPSLGYSRVTSRPRGYGQGYRGHVVPRNILHILSNNHQRNQIITLNIRLLSGHHISPRRHHYHGPVIQLQLRQISTYSIASLSTSASH